MGNVRGGHVTYRIWFPYPRVALANSRGPGPPRIVGLDSILHMPTLPGGWEAERCGLGGPLLFYGECVHYNNRIVGASPYNNLKGGPYYGKGKVRALQFYGASPGNSSCIYLLITIPPPPLENSYLPLHSPDRHNSRGH